MDDWTWLWLVVPGLATGLGGLGLLVVCRLSERLLDVLLGATGGIMLAAAVFSLLVPALEDGTVAEVVAGFVVGAGALAVLDAFIPHLHARLPERGHPQQERRAVLLLSAPSVWVAVAFAAATGLVEAPAAVLGYAIAESVSALLPFALAFAGGAMVYVVVDEMLPESRENGHEREATGGVVVASPR